MTSSFVICHIIKTIDLAIIIISINIAGVPLVIVAITLGVNKTEHYGEQPGGLYVIFSRKHISYLLENYY